jgi:hypothetical protein
VFAYFNQPGDIMKPFIAILLFAALGATGLTLAQNRINIEFKDKSGKVITIVCNDQSTNKACTMPPPPPPLPAVPALPPMPNLPQPPAPPTITEIANPPEPPSPPEPPEIIIPDEVHAACKGKEAGSKASWKPESFTNYSGTCVKQKGEMQLDVSHVSIRK